MIEQCKSCKNKENINGIIGCVYMDADCQNGEKYEAQIITNADRIRAMSDEELARWISDMWHGFVSKPWCDFRCQNCRVGDDYRCKKCALEWLKQPAEESK